MAITVTRPVMGGATANAYSSTTTQVATSQIRYVDILGESLDFMETPLTKMFGMGAPRKAAALEWTDERFVPMTATLNTTVDNATTTVAVTAGHGVRFQVNDQFSMDDELFLITGISTDNLTVTTRGWAGSTAAAHTAGVTVYIMGPATPENIDTVASPMARGEFYVNYWQIFDYGFQVSYRENETDNYLIRGPEYDFEVAHKFKEGAVHLERTIFRGRRLAAATTLPSTMGGFTQFITQHVTAKSGAAFTENDLMSLLQAMWQDVGPTHIGLTVVCDIFAKRVISSWVDQLRNLTATQTRAAAKLDTLETDFGTLEFVPHFHCPPNRLYVIDSSNFSIVPHGGRGRWFDEPLAHSGPYLKGHLYGDFSLEAKGDRAHGAITGFSVTATDYATLASA